MGIQHEGEILLTTAEVAKYLSIGTTTVARLCHRGSLVRRKVPGDRKLYVTLDSILAYRKADKLTLKDMAARLIALEDKVNALMENAVTTTYRDREMGQIDEILRKNHPNTFT